MVHFYGGQAVETHPMVNIYCGGHLIGTYGAEPDVVEGFDSPGGYAHGLMWRVVDVTTNVNSSDYYDVDCDLEALRSPSNQNEYWVTEDSTSY